MVRTLQNLLTSFFARNNSSRTNFVPGKTFQSKELSDPRRILFVNYGNTEETLQSIPALIALRQRFPHAEIAWIIGENTASLFLDHWAVNRFIIVRNDWFRHPAELRRVRQRLQSFAPHVAVDPQGSFGSALATWLAGAHYRIGHTKKIYRYLHNIRIQTKETHRIERNIDLLQPFGICGCDIGFDMPECEKDKIAALHILHEKGLHGNFALLHIGTERPEPQWNEERFGDVARHLLAEWNLPSLITWSGNDSEARAESAIHAAGGAALLAQETTMVQRGALARLATVFIGTHTPELQLAAASGGRTIGIMTQQSALENAPIGQEHKYVQPPGVTEYKLRKSSALQNKMDGITSEMVCKTCDEVLASVLEPSVLPMHQIPPAQRKAA